MGVNKVIYGGNTVIDLTNATATSDTVCTGYTAYGADGNLIIGTASRINRYEVNVTLPASGWAEGQQTVSVPGMTADASIVVGGDLGSEPEYSDCGVYCYAQAEGTLTFISDWAPDTDLVANVLFFT